ncbi:MAG: hypothetical protein KDA21_08905 [Phycisphaerales bacterium]|nr:hypothetical protein [Phycisphaerales bacterium]
MTTDPGVGLSVSGWGCNCPPYSVTGECESCDFEIFGPSEGAVTDTITINADTDNVTWSLQQADDPVARIVSQTGSSMTVEGLRAGSVTVVGTAPDDEGGECTSTHTIEFLTGMLTIVDPNPSHNVGGSITPNANALSQGGRQVDAIAADGVSRLLLRYKAPAAGTVRFTVNADSQGGSSAVDQVGMLSNPAGGGMGNPLTASTIQVGEDFYAFALLTAPQNFYRGSGDSARGLNNPRILHIEAEFMSSRGGDEPEMRDINLVPPPLVMAHGLWSGPETWAWNLSNDGRFYNQRVNYSGTNASPFEMNWPVVRNTIINTIQQYRDRGIASTQVDVIGHSMGGVLTRLYASKSSFRRNENFSRGDVHKLITLDTPHRGASTANLLVDNTGDPTVLGSLFQWLAYDDSGPTQSYCVECGAVYNLRTDYTPGALAAFTSIPAHAVYGTGGSDYSDIAALIGAVGSQLAPWLNALRLLDLGLDVVFGFDEHDLIVEVSSQRNGLPNGNTSHFSFYDGIHTSLPGSNNVSARVLELLMAPTNGPLYAAGFPAGRSDSAPREVNLPQINLRGGAINVLSPAPGAMVMSGDMVTVTVEPMVGFDFEVVAISGPGGESLYLESAPFTGMLSIPMTESGLRRIGIAARLAGSEDVALADVNIMVVPAATLMAIRPVIDSVVLTQFSPSFSPEFLGEYDDGIDRPIDLRDMILSVDNRRVAQLDGMGTLTSNRPGMTTLRAEYLGRTTEIAVSVAGLVGDYNDDGLVDSRDFVVFRECAASSDAACLDRADFDGDGDIDDDDFNTFVASMHYPADCNDNGMLDVEEIWNALVADGNLDGIPDSCGNWMEPRFDLTVGAQSIIADADGRFRIPNIAAPDLFGTNGPGSAPDFLSDDYLRATGTYLIDQDIYYAFSQPFQIRQGRAYTIGDLVITPTPPPFPDRIHIAPAAGQPSTITALNGTSQMEVIGILQDGSELDVTPRSSWTTYRTSNAAVASVGPDGLVTAHGNGPVFITAMNEGATSTVKLIVSLGDPLTTVEGFVLTPSETPVPDAVVTVLGQSQSAMTDASGFFSIPGVATTLGNINVRAISANFIGISGALVPVPGGITDAGIVDTQEAPDTSGREFFLVFQPNLGGAQLSVFISSSVPTAGHIEAPGFNDDFIVEPGITTTVILPSSLISNVNDGVHSQVVRVTADADVVVYGLNRVTSSTDAFASLPVETYGSSYRAMAYRGGAGGPSQLAVVAAVDGTTVTITPQSTLGSHPAGTPYTVVLDRLEAYQIQGTDVTGTLITADAPIGVFAGAQCTNVPTGVLYCDHLCEQIPPTTTWGRDVITLPIQSRLNGDTFRILAHMNNTSVSIDGPAPEMFTLNAGEFAERILEGNNEIFADKPILVAQFSNSTNYDGQTGDPFMMLVPPAEQFLAEYTFLTPTSGFSNNFVNVIAQTVDAQAGAVNLDGVALDPSMFQTVGDGFYSCAKLSIGTGSHTMNAAHPFGIYVYGFGSFDSYGYPGGLALEVITGP